MKDDNKSRDIFYGIVAVATLIVALVGATLAYFSVAISSNEGVVNAKAAIVSIEYNDSQQVTASADKLIPSSLEVVKQVYEDNKADFGTEDALRSNVCIDAYDQQVCSIYRFTVSSDVERNFTATLNNESNGFQYLAYAVKDVTNNTWLNLDNTGNEVVESLGLAECSNTDDDDTNDCFTTSGTEKAYNTTPKAINSIFGYSLDSQSRTVMTGKTISSTAQVYDIVIFLKENNENQNIDQGKTYSGTIMVESTDAGSNGVITGRASRS